MSKNAVGSPSARSPRRKELTASLMVIVSIATSSIIISVTTSVVIILLSHAKLILQLIPATAVVVSFATMVVIVAFVAHAGNLILDLVGGRLTASMTTASTVMLQD